MNEMRPAWVEGPSRVFVCSFCGVRQGLAIHTNGGILAVRGWHVLDGRLEFREPKRGRVGQRFEPVDAELPAIAVCRNQDCAARLKLDLPGFDRPP